VSGSLSILLVEDNADLARTVADHLEAKGHRLDFAADGLRGVEAALAGTHDLVILDIALPRLDGLEVCRRLRERADRHVPILMLTARDTLPDKLAGFGAGADDYLCKPFALAELEVRCLALSGRHRLGMGHALVLGDLVLDRRRRTVTRAGQSIHLHPIGWQILLTLAEAHPRTVTRSELTERVWGDDPPDSDALRTHLYLLRQTLDRPFDRPILKTVHSIGFRLDVAG
jgi:DNA-binding response OmpR family regulator